MTDKLKNQAILRDFRTLMTSKYGAPSQEIINAEIFRLVSKKKIEQKV